MTFKSTKKVIVDPVSLYEDFVFLTINSIRYDFKGFTGTATYTYEDKILKQTYPEFSNDQANYIAQGVTGNTFTEIYNAIVFKATMYELATSKPFGLDASDWEVYEAPKEVTEELPEEPSDHEGE